MPELGSLTKLPLGIHRVTGQRAKLVWGAPGYAPQPTEVIAPGLIHRNGATNSPQEQQHDGFLQRLFDGEVGEGRNNSLNRFTYWLRARDFPEELVRQNVLYVNGLFEEPLEEEELERTVLRPR